MVLATGREQDAVDLLVRSGALTADHASEAQDLAALWGTGPIDVVLAKGLAPPAPVATALSQATNLPLLDPIKTPLDARGAERPHLNIFVRGQFLPWRKQGGETLFAVINPYTAESEIAAVLGHGARFAMTVTTKAVMTAALLEAFGHDVVEQAIYGLSDAAPEMSARRGITWQQLILFAALLGLIGLAFSRAPAPSFVAASLAAGLFFIAIMVFRLILMLASLTRPREDDRAAQRPIKRTLPIYTILVPLRDEATLLPQLIDALGALDYPATKLDVILLLEAGDERTRLASRTLALDGRFRILTVPDRLPRTKPKACNFGLAFARGDFVTIYDAEDRPDPDQLLSALAAFEAHPETECMQARLGFYNVAENWLTRGIMAQTPRTICADGST